MNTFKISKFFIYAAVFSVIIVLSANAFPFITGKYIWFRVAIDLALLFFLFGIFKYPLQEAKKYLEKLKEVFYSPIGITVSVFVAIFILAGVFGVNSVNSFWSGFERGDGGFQMLHYYAFFILLATMFSEQRQWIKLFNCSIISAILVIIYGVLAEFSFFQLKMGFLGTIFGSGDRFYGAIGNPAYLAAYLIFAIFYVWYVFFAKYRHKLLSFGGITTFILFASFLIAFLEAQTRGAVLGLSAGIAVFLIYNLFNIKKIRKSFSILLIFLLIFFGLGIAFKNSAVIQTLPFSRIFDISSNTKTFQDRISVWKISVDGFKERPLLGFGPENFSDVFVRHFNVKNFNPLDKNTEFTFFDRAHSVIFDYLSEIGLLGLLSFLSIFGVYYWQFFRTRININTDKNQNKPNKSSKIQYFQNSYQSVAQQALMFSLPIAYLVQGLVLFDTLPIYINLFLFFAFAQYFFNTDKTENQIHKFSVSELFVKVFSFIGIIVVIVTIVYGSIFAYLKIETYSKVNKSSYTIENFKNQFEKIYEIPSLAGKDELSRFLINSTEGAVSERTYQSKLITRELIDYSESKINYNDLRDLLPAANIYTIMWERYDKSNEEDYQKAVAYYSKALEIGHNFPPTLYGLISLYARHGDVAGVENIGKTILQYWPQDDNVANILKEINKR